MTPSKGMKKEDAFKKSEILFFKMTTDFKVMI